MPSSFKRSCKSSGTSNYIQPQAISYGYWSDRATEDAYGGGAVLVTRDGEPKWFIPVLLARRQAEIEKIEAARAKLEIHGEELRQQAGDDESKIPEPLHRSLAATAWGYVRLTARIKNLQRLPFYEK